ncbi:MAG: nucleotide exchange factor GrpE [Candidatus Gracilibacteria bacterium]
MPQDELARLQQELDNMTATAKRALADLQNFKRRADEERGELQVFANMNMLSAIFPALDNFTRAFATIPEDLKNNDWAKGIMAIEANLLSALTSTGLETIDQVGIPADPQKHQVLMEVESAPEQAGQVVEIFEKGYAFKGKTIRPAKVSVGKKEEW